MKSNTSREASRTRPVRSVPAEKLTLTLKLEVTDPEVVGELRKREGEERETLALSALRIGVLALRSASGQLDSNVLHTAGMKLIADLGEALSERGAEQVRELTESLQQHLDPATGTLALKLQQLVESGGALEARLDEKLGAQGAQVAQLLSASVERSLSTQSGKVDALLARHLGEDSPLSGALTRADAQALREHVQGLVQGALTAQREQLLQELSPDAPGSALSVLLQRLEASHHVVSQQLSPDVEGSAMEQLSRLLETTRERMDQSLSLDHERGALGKLKRDLSEMLEALEQRNAQFQSEARGFFSALSARQAGARVLKGTFEEQLAGLMASESHKCGDLFEPLGAKAGFERFVTQMGPESANPGTKLLWLAAKEKGPTVAQALAHLDEARKQVGAQGAVLVFAKAAAPAELPAFARFGPDVVVVWDPNDEASDVYVRAGLSVARALVVKLGKRGEGMAKTLAVIDEATRSIARQLTHLTDVKKLAEGITGSSSKIIERVNAARTELDVELKALDQQLLALKALQRAS